MNWCKIGIHDVEKFNDSDAVEQKVTEFMTSKGYSLNKRGLGVSRNQYWVKGDIEIPMYTWGDTDIEKAMPLFPKTEVCLRCKRVSTNYKIEDTFASLQRIIDSAECDFERKRTAEEIRLASQK